MGRSVTILQLIQPLRRPTSVPCWILPASRFSSTMDSNKSQSILSTRNSNSFSTITCLLLSRKNMLRKVLTGSWWTLAWTWQLLSSCLKNPWVSGLSLRKNPFFPKATDKSFEEKLKASLGKLPVFLKPASKTDKNAHFGVSHYAGVVNYNVTSWLEKNKDPVNETVVELFKSTSKSQLLVHLWRDHPGQPTVAPKDDGKKRKKGGGGKTVSSVYLVSLAELMTTLYSCEPHFVRCLVSNNHKKPGDVEPPLIMHQLTCNGVLEGIRICMRGFPNRMMYPDFKLRYACLGQAEIASSSDNKT